MKGIIAACALVAALLAPTTGAVHDDCSTEYGITLDLAGEAYVFYQDREYLFELWVYKESNGRDGLQRGGEHILFEGWGDPCGNPEPEPDVVIF